LETLPSPSPSLPDVFKDDVGILNQVVVSLESIGGSNETPIPQILVVFNIGKCMKAPGMRREERKEKKEFLLANILTHYRIVVIDGDEQHNQYPCILDFQLCYSGNRIFRSLKSLKMNKESCSCSNPAFT
jgi:hypothetical protein